MRKNDRKHPEHVNLSRQHQQQLEQKMLSRRKSQKWN